MWPGVSNEYVEKTMALSSNVSSFSAAHSKMPENRRELEVHEEENDLDNVTPWFTVVRFSYNENGQFQIYQRKGWFIWEQGSGTTTFPKSNR
jgi:hypothetical protein